MIRGLALLVCCVVGVSTVRAGEIAAYNPYLTSPFVREEGGGLAADVVAYLNRQPGNFRFVLKNVPKARVVALAERDGGTFSDVIMFQMPGFMGDAEGRKYRWTRSAFVDRNVLVFAQHPGEKVTRPSDLAGLRFGGVRGHHYRGLDGVQQDGRLHREDVGDESGNLRKLAAGRIDVTQMARSTFAAYSAEYGERFYVQDSFDPPVLRQFAVGLGNPALHRWLENVVQRARSDPAWRELLARYQLQASN